MKDKVIAAYTGPNSGLTRLELDAEQLTEDNEVAGIKNWNNPSDFAYGISLSLYEEDRRKEVVHIRNGIRQRQPFLLGEPIADVFAIVVRENSAILALADGASWGKKARLAARCAVHSAVTYVTENMDRLKATPVSRTLANILRESMDIAQDCILKHHATLTTLSVAVVCEMTSVNWGLYVASVGDSPVYVYCPCTKEIWEATIGCHPESGIRDVQLSGGALGPAIGTLADMENFTLAYMPVYPGDIVFLTSDGISDNFLPSILWPSSDGSKRTDKMESSYVFVTQDMCSPIKPCCENVPQMRALLQRHQELLQHNMSAQTVTACLVNFTVETTNDKRCFRSDCLDQNIHIKRKMNEDEDFAKYAKQVPGKLDHATIVAYTVGYH